MATKVKSNEVRNSVAVIARGRKAGVMRDRRKRRMKDRLRKELVEHS